MTISQVYQKYQINPTLQQHMCRVAGVADIICKYFSAPLDTEEILIACLLHDMGNIIKFKFDLFPEFFEPEGVEYWQDVQKNFIEKYGKNSHAATMAIVKDIGVAPRVAELIDAISFNQAKKNSESDDFAKKICMYADMRVTPHGVTSLAERLADGQKRYFRKEEDQRFAYAMGACIKKMEKQIFEQCEGFSPEQITEESLGDREFYLKRFLS